MQHPVIALATAINKLAKKVNETEGVQRDIGVMMCSLAIIGMCDDIGIKEPVEVGHMLFSNALQGAGINHNVRIIRDVLAGKQVGCGMCESCKASQQDQEELPPEVAELINKIMGNGGKVTVMHFGRRDQDNPPKTKH